MPPALVFAGLAVLPVRETYRSLRISATQFGRDYTEQMFMSSLLLAVAAFIYPYFVFLLPVLPYLFYRRHILDAKGMWAFLLAVAVVALYGWIVIRLGWIKEPFTIFF